MPERNDETETSPEPQPEPEPTIVVVPDIIKVEYGEPEIGKIRGTTTIEIDTFEIKTGLE